MRRSTSESNFSERFIELRNDYDAARQNRFQRRRTGIMPTGSGADWHYRNERDYLRIIELSRDLDRNNCYVGQLGDRCVTNAIQDGIPLDAQTGDTAIDKDMNARWTYWGNDPKQCDIGWELNWHDIEKLGYRHTLFDGDIFIIPTIYKALQMFEGHRCRTPSGTSIKSVVCGILLDEFRRHQQYWFTKDDIDPLQPLKLVGDMTKYDGYDKEGNRNVFHVRTRIKRISQTRGISAFAPIFDLCSMFEDINFAKLVQQQVVSCIAFLESRDAGMADLPSPGLGERTTEQYPNGAVKTIEGIAPGLRIIGAPGAKLSGFSPNVPNPEFFPHVKLILTLIGINLGIPLVLALLDSSETNFSGWRGAVDQARMGFRDNQRSLVSKLHTPTYLWKVRQWLEEDAALRNASQREGINIFGHRFNPPAWPYIEPINDAKADLLRLKGCLISPRRLHAERGRDWQEVSVETVEDNTFAIRAAKEKAVEINSEFKDGQPVHWREVISLPMPDGLSVATGENPKPPTQGADADAA